MSCMLFVAELFLNHNDIESLQDFEEGCLELYFREKNKNMESSTDERIRVMHERYVRSNQHVCTENVAKLGFGLATSGLCSNVCLAWTYIVQEEDI